MILCLLKLTANEMRGSSSKIIYAEFQFGCEDAMWHDIMIPGCGPQFPPAMEPSVHKNLDSITQVGTYIFIIVIATESCTHIFVNLVVCTFMEGKYVCVCVCAYAYLCACACVYIYVCVCTHTWR